MDNGRPRESKAIRHHRHGLIKVSGPLREHRLKLIEPLLVSIVAPESGGPLQLRDDRVERTVLVMGRAEIAEASVWLVTQLFQDRLSDARFADAGFAR